MRFDPKVTNLTDEQRHFQAILDLYAGEYHAFYDPDTPTADELFDRAIGLFSRNEKDSWCLPWADYERAKLALTRGEHGRAEMIVHAALAEIAAEHDEREHDFEIQANLYRLLGDISWAVDERWSALRHFAKAIFSAYFFNAYPDPPDEYTRTFYCDIADHVLSRLVSLLPDQEAVRRACAGFIEMWKPYRDQSDPLLDRTPVEALAEQRRELLFARAPSDNDLEDEDGSYVAMVRRAYQKLGEDLDQAVSALPADPLARRLRSALRRRRPSPTRKVGVRDAKPSSLPPSPKPRGPAPEPDLFTPMTDPAWPDHWLQIPGTWRLPPEELLTPLDRQEVIGSAMGDLDEDVARILELRDLRGCSYQEVTLELGVSRSDQSLALHTARAHVRRRIDDALTKKLKEQDGQA
jgi:DNA-directed RNA polymerase specialized sigma24 family protein